MKDYVAEVAQNDKELAEANPQARPKDPVKALKLILKEVKKFQAIGDEMEVGMLLDEVEEIADWAIKNNKKK